MRFYTSQHRYYCGIDLHARTMYLCILDRENGDVVLHRNVRCEPRAFLRAVAPFRDDLEEFAAAAHDILRRSAPFDRVALQG
jgi:hypothetical protein